MAKTSPFTAQIAASAQSAGKLKLAAAALALVGLSVVHQTYVRDLDHEKKIAALVIREDAAAREVAALDHAKDIAEASIESAQQQVAEAKEGDAKDNAKAALEAARSRFASYEQRKRDAEKLRQDRNQETRQQKRLLAERQSFEVFGFRVPVPAFLAATAWNVILVILLFMIVANRHRFLRSVNFVSVTNHQPVAGGGISPPFWLAPLPGQINGIQRQACLHALGWSRGTHIRNTILSMATACLALLVVCAVSWIGLVLGWAGGRQGFAISVPPASPIGLPSSWIAASIIMSAGAVLALIAAWLLPDLSTLWYRNPIPWSKSRRMVSLAALGVFSAAVGAAVLGCASATQRLRSAQWDKLKREAESLSCRFIKRRHPSLALGEPKIPPGLYVTSLRCVPARASIKLLEGEVSRVSRSSAPQCASEPDLRLAVVHIVDSENRLIGMGPRFNRDALQPLPSGVALRRGLGATAALEQLAIARSVNGDTAGAIDQLLDAAVGEAARRQAFGSHVLDDLRLPLDMLKANIRLLDLAAKLAKRQRLSAALEATAVVAAAHAEALEKFSRLLARQVRRKTDTLAPETKVVSEVLIQMGIVFSKETKRKIKALNAKKKVHNGQSIREARLADELKERARSWFALSQGTPKVQKTPSTHLRWGDQPGQGGSTRQSRHSIRRGGKDRGESCTRSPTLTRRSVVRTLRGGLL